MVTFRAIPVLLLILHSCMLGACTISAQTVHEFGEPDLVGEQSEGDEARYYPPSHTPEYPWKNSIKTYYYVKRNMKVILTKNGPQQRNMTPDERKRIESLLAPLMPAART